MRNMKTRICVSIIAASLLLLFSGSSYSEEDYSSKLEVILEPTYHCAADHLHIPGTIKNISDVAFGMVRVEGRAYDKAAKLISSTSSWVRSDTIKPGETAHFDLEFLDIAGAVHDRVESYKVEVVEVKKASP